MLKAACGENAHRCAGSRWTRPLSINRKRGPHFIGVGPEKTGTTWIHTHLKAHPNVILPPLKELRYFWERANFPNEKFIDRLILKDNWHKNQYRDYFRHFLKRYSRNPARLFTHSKRLAWDCRYLFTEHDDNWYLGCFDRKDGFVCGEISPQYFFLGDGEIKHIHELLPDVQIVISLRKPIDWFCSLLRMHAPQCIKEHDEGALDDLLSRYSSSCSFSKALRRWKRYFSEDQLLVVFYDELSSSPWQFYSRICGFLRIEPDPARLPELAKRVNEGNDLKLPRDFREKIKRGWREDIEELSSILPTMPSNWKKFSSGS
jgi:hypothetical protein